MQRQRNTMPMCKLDFCTKRSALIFKRFLGAEFRCKNIPSLMAVPASNVGDGRGQTAAVWNIPHHIFDSVSKTYMAEALRRRGWPN
jgi:hypothetical protein